MKNSKKCKKNGCKNNNANSMNEAQLESVQGGMGVSASWIDKVQLDSLLHGTSVPASCKFSDGARGKVIQPRVCKEMPPIDGKIQPR